MHIPSFFCFILLFINENANVELTFRNSKLSGKKLIIFDI